MILICAKTNVDTPASKLTKDVSFFSFKSSC